MGRDYKGQIDPALPSSCLPDLKLHSGTGSLFLGILCANSFHKEMHSIFMTIGGYYLPYLGCSAIQSWVLEQKGLHSWLVSQGSDGVLRMFPLPVCCPRFAHGCLP